MESLRCGEALLRSSQPLLSFLVPAKRNATSSIAPIARQCRPQRSQWHPSRSFTTSGCQRQPDDTPSAPRNFPSTSPTSRDTVSDEISSMLDSSLDLNKNTPTAPDSRTSRFHSRDAQAQNPPSRGLSSYKEKFSPGTSSVDDILNGLGMDKPNRYNGGLGDISSMLSARGGPDDYLTRDQPELESPTMKLDPTVGRTVNVNTARGMDVGRAFRQLEILCARNSVRKDSMRQRFHERPGLKRKRLKSERWRRNFKANFKETVALVQKMRKQGW